MSFDPNTEVKQLDAITIIACLGNYPLESTIATYTRLGMQRADGSWYRPPWFIPGSAHTGCLRCLCKSLTRNPGEDGRTTLIDAVLGEWMAVHGFAPKSDLHSCQCRILPGAPPRWEGTWKKKTHQF